MPSFGSKSKEELYTCDPRLVEVFEEVVKYFDCSVLEGRRNKEKQDEYYRIGRSKVQWPDSKHNCEEPELSKAADVAPYPIDWNDLDRFRYFAGFVVGIAATRGITLRWGGDWDRDTDLKDQNFNDLPHFELVED